MPAKFKNRYEAVLLKYALGFPEAYEDHPWDERVVKVGKKISSVPALALPFTSPTGYGLGKAGWVTATFGLHETPPVDLLRDWIDESYRAVAPKKLVRLLPSP